MTGIHFFDNHQLERSNVIANSTMNRDRHCVGTNSYTKELGFNPIEFLRSRPVSQPEIRWLDLCCGSGRALIEAAQSLVPSSLNVTITGIDLVGMFNPIPPELTIVKLQEGSLTEFAPTQSYDLITCIHGLHYIGDKLDLIQRAIGWLKPNGRFAANLDLNNFKQLEPEPSSIGPAIMRELKRQGLGYNDRRHLLTCPGHRRVQMPYAYVGADDQAGANYTGQPVVDSYYRFVTDHQ
jgi:trans-aconitate methyltransferase